MMFLIPAELFSSFPSVARDTYKYHVANGSRWLFVLNVLLDLTVLKPLKPP
jgi:hypothetical protein